MFVKLSSFLLMCGILAAEPNIPAYDRFHSGGDAKGGMLLIKELSCTACHKTDKEHLKAAPAPVLSGSNARIKKDWIKKHLMNPDGTRMPDVFKSEKEKTETVNSLTAYILSLPSKKVSFKAHRDSDAGLGKKLFHRIGCFACHSKDSGSGRILKGLKNKYTQLSLAEFLQNPHIRRPAGKMPRFKLDNYQANDIAKYLLFENDKDIFTDRSVLNQKFDRKLAAKGRTAFAKYGCASCHTAEGVKSVFNAKSLSALTSGKCSKVNYALSDKKISAISKALKIQNKTLNGHDRIDLTLKEKNCYACHSRNGIGGPSEDKKAFFHGNESLADEGRFPPNLNSVGAKLTDASFSKILNGNADTRPYLNVKMPDFGKSTVSLIALLKKTDLKSSSPLPAGDSQAGRLLVGNTAAGCINCHNIGKAKSAGIEGPDLSRIHTKVNQDWFKNNLLNPAAFRPGTLMPSLWPGGKSSLPHILKGDTDKQIAAIWEYLKNPVKPPAGALQNTGEFQLKVKDLPVYHRTFFKKSIPVLYIGFPNKINVAFDTDRARLIMSWQGEFVDAYKTWYLRRDPQAEILSKKTIDRPPVFQDDSKAPVKLKFDGYKRLPQGTVLMYSGNDFKVKEILKINGGSLLREFHITAGEKAKGSIKINDILKPLKSGIYKEEIK